MKKQEKPTRRDRGSPVHSTTRDDRHNIWALGKHFGIQRTWGGGQLPEQPPTVHSTARDERHNMWVLVFFGRPCWSWAKLGAGPTPEQPPPFTARPVTTDTTCGSWFSLGGLVGIGRTWGRAQLPEQKPPVHSTTRDERQHVGLGFLFFCPGYTPLHCLAGR